MSVGPIPFECALPSYLCPFGKSRAAVELEQITTVEIVDSLGGAFDGVDRVLTVARQRLLNARVHCE